MCSNFSNVCLSNRNAFLSEQHLYTKKALRYHIDNGDPEKQIEKHPKCVHCNIPFFSEEDLINHGLESHYHCHLCDRNGKLLQSFKTIVNLV